MNDLNDFLKKLSEQFETFAGAFMREIRDTAPKADSFCSRAPDPDFFRAPAAGPEDIRDNVVGPEDRGPEHVCRKDLTKAAMALVEAGVEDETTIQMLQKYWDLRRSEAIRLIDYAHEQVGLG